jgi:hypothetical protein
MKKIILGKTYTTSFGTEFTPVSYERGGLKKQTLGNIHADYSQRTEARFIDADGNRIRKSKLKSIKVSS